MFTASSTAGLLGVAHLGSKSQLALPRQHCTILGVEITPTTRQGVLSQIQCAAEERHSLLIAGHNLHSVYLYHTNNAMKQFYDSADIVLADGAPVHWDYKLSKGSTPNQRLGSTDWIPYLHQTNGLKSIYVLGASLHANRHFVEALSDTLPDVHVFGSSGEAWNESKYQRALAQIRRKKPQLILVGLGMPLQEHVVLRLIKECSEGATIATVGGAIEQLAGYQRNAPRWLGSLGLEWAWRLATQPRRLAYRYLVEPWKLLWIRILQSVRRRTR